MEKERDRWQVMGSNFFGKMFTTPRGGRRRFFRAFALASAKPKKERESAKKKKREKSEGAERERKKARIRAFSDRISER
jgi:hypothetical protein